MRYLEWSTVKVTKIFGEEVYDGLPEAPGIARRRRNEIGAVLFFGCQDELVVLVAQRLEQGQIRSRVGAFPEVFSMPESRSECT